MINAQGSKHGMEEHEGRIAATWPVAEGLDEPAGTPVACERSLFECFAFRQMPFWDNVSCEVRLLVVARNVSPFLAWRCDWRNADSTAPHTAARTRATQHPGHAGQSIMAQPEHEGFHGLRIYARLSLALRQDGRLVNRVSTASLKRVMVPH